MSDFGTIQSGPLSTNTSAQFAELLALTKTLHLSKGKRVNIYIDSKYAFLILHAHATIWKAQIMLTTAGSLVKYYRRSLPSWMLFYCPSKCQ
jgi:ribonuclease HI